MTLKVPGYTPKKRNSGTRKRQAIILISTEGKNQTETNYFNGFSNRKVHIHFATGRFTDPVNMVKKLSSEMINKGFNRELGDKAFCLIDADVSPSKNQEIAEADKIARQRGIELIVSAPCFELWFLCHYSFSMKQYGSNDELIADLMKNKEFSDYKKNCTGLYDKLLPWLDKAINNAKRLEVELIKLGKTKHTVDFSPSTEAYHVVETIKQIEKSNSES